MSWGGMWTAGLPATVQPAAATQAVVAMPGVAGVAGIAGIAGISGMAGMAAAAGASGAAGAAATATAEQWAAVQWQQWAQWQEQYRQWQLQYGEKFAEQTLAYQTGAQPPLPPTGPAEARPPPPPDAPPPQPKADPKKAQASFSQYAAYAEPNAVGGVDRQTADWAAAAWYGQARAQPGYGLAQPAPDPAAPSEEERQFDVQFKKWEEEFEAWKRQNADHPDRAAYLEYEKKFQACRAQLLERKEQMRARRTAAAPAPSRIPAAPKGYTTAGYYRAEQAREYADARSTDRLQPASEFVRMNSVFPADASGSKTIPGLDLVDDRARKIVSEVVDITDGDESNSRKPDLKAISKGINNILGDQKLLNMLSLVTQNNSSNPLKDSSIQNSGLSGWSDGSAIVDPNRSEIVQAYQNNMDQLYKSQIDGNYSELALAARNYSQMPYLSEAVPEINGETDYYNQHGYGTTQPGYSQGLENNYYDRSDGMSNYSDNKYDSHQNDLDDGRPKWMDFPILEPHISVDYEHKSLETSIEFLEPVQTFDYGHLPSDKGPLNDGNVLTDEEINLTKTLSKNDYRSFNENDKSNDSTYRCRNVEYPPMRYEDRYREPIDRPRRNYGKERDFEKREERIRSRPDDRNRFRDRSRDGGRSRFDRSNSGERFPRRMSDSKSQSPILANEDVSDDNAMETSLPTEVTSTVMIDDLLESPGREVRPEKIVIILRGLPGSGKSYLAKLIKDREVENGGSARILSMDDYFMVENEDTTKDSENGRKMEGQGMRYEYDASMESVYISSLTKSLKRTITDGFFPFIIVDSINDQLQHYSEMEVVGKQYGFKVYVCEMDVDIQTCFKRNLHERSLDDIQKLSENWTSTPIKFTLLDATTLLQTAAIDHVQMEDVSDGDLDEPSKDVTEAIEEEVQAPFSSKWDKMDDTDKLARLDGTSKPLRHNISTMEDFLQLDDWETNKSSQPGKKSVRWADIEERRQQEKMRAIGFVVGQTDWERMNDPTQGSSALTQTKYIERINRY